MVVQQTDSGKPAKIAACRAGAWPIPAETTLPKITSSTLVGCKPARSTAARTATAPSSLPFLEARLPLMRPMGVRAYDTMTAVRPEAA